MMLAPVSTVDPAIERGLLGSEGLLRVGGEIDRTETKGLGGTMEDNETVNPLVAERIVHPYTHPSKGTQTHYVYALYAADGTSLYVGRTAVPGNRLEQHMLRPWWPEVARIEIAVYADYETARDAEKAQIQWEHPTHNEYFTDNFRASSAATRIANREARHALGELCPPSARCSHCRKHRELRDEQVSD